MIKRYDNTGLCILTPETVRDAVILKYINKLFKLDMIDYQTAAERSLYKSTYDHLKKLETLNK